jgi:hypothetical protein
MPGNERETGGEARPPPVLVLHVTLARGEPLVGSVRLLGGELDLGFRGWIAFMSAIDRLRGLADTDATPGTLGDHWNQ